MQVEFSHVGFARELLTTDRHPNVVDCFARLEMHDSHRFKYSLGFCLCAQLENQTFAKKQASILRPHGEPYDSKLEKVHVNIPHTCKSHIMVCLLSVHRWSYIASFWLCPFAQTVLRRSKCAASNI